MRAIVLGSAAGGGFPQWNCACPNCTRARAGDEGLATPRTQDAIAVGEERVLLVNASPDVHAQIRATPALWPREARHTPIAAVVLTNGDLDHVLGLFSLRESQPIAVYATAAVWRGLEASVFVRTLRRFEGQLAARTLALGAETELADARGAPLGLSVRAFATPGKLPVHLVGHADPSAEDNVGLAIRERAGGASLAYATACGSLEGVEAELARHDAVLFDGTFYREDELVALGLGSAHARDMAHVPIERSLPALAALRARRIYTHVNNTNPILAPRSDERRAVEAAGWEVAFDGMEIRL